jgi:phosphoribosylformylglycinamidine synthase
VEKIEITPELIEQHGLTEQEYQTILSILGREPTLTELGIFSVMWSEHCSYKCSKRTLKLLPTKGKAVLVGPGENAGVLDIGDNLAVAFKIESHNHPSAIEPYNGAATGVGGILRDIFTMGARPIAMLNPLRFGRISDPHMQWLVGGVIGGIADYGNCVGVPTVAGDIYFQDCYEQNILVNVMCVGLMRHDQLMLARAQGPGNLVVYYGSPTGRDGIHGATFASKEDPHSQQRSAVQVGDPFMGKKILEATLELIARGAAVGIQDMGAAGLTCSSCEMASRANTGVEIDLDRVPQRAEGMSSYEIMLSESQERMLAIIPREKIKLAREVLERWEVGCYILGEVKNDGLLRVKQRGEVVAEIPAVKIADQSPQYSPEAKRPAYLDELPVAPVPYPPPPDSGDALLRLLRCPTISSKRWVYSQYDHMVQTATVVRPGGGDAAVLRVKGTAIHLAVTVDGNSTMCYLDPETGGKMVVAEAARNVAMVGAEPLGLTNCLNFGNPNKPEVFWTFDQCVRGMAEACRVLQTPVTGGNVSFYNESKGLAVFPSPIVGMVGRIAPPLRMLTPGWKNAGDRIFLVGGDEQHLGGSVFAQLWGPNSRAGRDQLCDERQPGPVVGPCPRLDLDLERALQQFVLEANRRGLINAAHDLSEGGLAVALAECCIASADGLGVAVTPPQLKCAATWLFSEAPSRAVVACEESKAEDLTRLARECGVPLVALGKIGGARLTIAGLLNVSVSEIHRAYETPPY